MSHRILDIITPNKRLSSWGLFLIYAGWFIAAIVGWFIQPFDVLPSPTETLAAFPRLLSNQGLLPNLGITFWTNLKALMWTTALSLVIVYGGRLPIFKPVSSFTATVRCWGLTGVMLVAILVLHTDSRVKFSLLIFSLIGFFVLGLMTAVNAIPTSRYDYARTLGMNEWWVHWYVVIRGTLPDVWDGIRMNNAMGLMVLSSLEASYKSEGGTGYVFDSLKRAGDYAGIGAMQISIAVTSIATDLIIQLLKRKTCRYFFLNTDKRS